LSHAEKRIIKVRFLVEERYIINKLHYQWRMKLSEENVEAFRVLFRKHFGREISKEEAREKGAKFLRLMQLIYKPMKQVEFDAVQKQRKELNP
jgi:hypothetical protein